LPRIALVAAAGAVFGILITRMLCIPIQRKQAGAATLPRPEKWPNQFAKPVPARTLVDHFLLSAGHLSAKLTIVSSAMDSFKNINDRPRWP
jgi:hypothetical protein